jgi:hypothetical protein
MRFDARLTGEAADLARTHKALLDRLPATFAVSIFVELEKWPILFAPERAYQRALVEHLAGFDQSTLKERFATIAKIEQEVRVDDIDPRAPAKFQEDAQKLLRSRRMLYRWREEIAAIFNTIDPAIDQRLYPPDAPRRIVVQIYDGHISVQPDKLWSRFRNMGVRVPLKLDGVQGSQAFLRALVSGRADHAASVPTLFSAAKQSAGFGPLDAWILESSDGLHTCCDAAGAASHDAVCGFSYERLRPYRDELTQALYRKIQSGVASPQEFAAYARSLTIAPAAGVLLHAADVLHAFVRDVMLTGNGTLFVNNTFVEWAAVQAMKRAQPRVIMTRYGVRDKMKPFSSMLLFSQPRASDQIPLIEDPFGSFVDVEQLSYYVWLNAEKSPAYRQKTLYLFLAEGIDEMLAIRSDQTTPGPAPKASPATLADVCTTMARWLGVDMPSAGGRVLEPLAS